MHIRSDGQMTRTRAQCAGLHVVVDAGWQGLTFKAVSAKLSDVSWQTVKHHFRTHTGLQGAVHDHMRQVLESKEAKGNLGKDVVASVRRRLAELKALHTA